jgi:phospholipid-binding lipoprotein MlaA
VDGLRHGTIRGTVIWHLVIVVACFGTTGCAGLLDPVSDASALPAALSSTEGRFSDATTSVAPPVLMAWAVEPAASLPDVAPDPAPQLAQNLDQPRSSAQSQKPVGSDPTGGILPEEAEPYDPFATDASKAAEDYDPWEPFNTRMFALNRNLDRYLIKPVAQVYDKIVPDPLERGLSNSFHNIRFVPRFINNILQGKFKGAGLEIGRFVINSTLGVAGFFDFADKVLGMQTPDEDTGQTLGAWGIKPGPYLVLPLYPPLTLRDAFGTVGDFLLDPVNYFIFAVVRVGQSALVFHQTTATFGFMGMRAGEIINDRSINLERFQGVEEATLDLYSAVRNAYLQRRAQDIAR